MSAPGDLPAGATLIEQGAEGRVYSCEFLGRPAVVKERFSKAYRHPDLDKRLTNSRVTTEARVLQRCAKLGVDVPVLLFVDLLNARLYFEFVQGPTIKTIVRESSLEDLSDVATKIGQALATMHDGDIVHGDLTTSNMMLRTREDKTKSLVILDFGLSCTSGLEEDKAVDLYVLEKAFLSTHPNSDVLVEKILTTYRKSSKNQKKVLKKLEDVRQRGRKRVMVG